MRVLLFLTGFFLLPIAFAICRLLAWALSVDYEDVFWAVVVGFPVMILIGYGLMRLAD